MNVHTHKEIANNLALWNEFFNTDGAMSDEDFHAMSESDKLQMLSDAFGNE